MQSEGFRSGQASGPLAETRHSRVGGTPGALFGPNTDHKKKPDFLGSGLCWNGGNPVEPLELLPKIGGAFDHPTLLAKGIDERQAGCVATQRRVVPNSTATFAITSRLRVSGVLSGTQYHDKRSRGRACLAPRLRCRFLASFSLRVGDLLIC